MRLTMRTLLNWINHNLSEEDGVLVAQKVEESDLARALKTQIEDVMRREHLPAPAVLDGTPLGNANSSAEYLDNAMASTQTLEYEKFCLHSDVILGEVASCHEILSHVLTDLPEISPNLRARLCNLYQFMDTSGSEFSIPTQLVAPANTSTVTQSETLSADSATEETFDVADFEPVDEKASVSPQATVSQGTRNTQVASGTSTGALKGASSAGTPVTSPLANITEESSQLQLSLLKERLWRTIAIVSITLFVLLLILDVFLPECTPGRIFGRIFGM